MMSYLHTKLHDNWISSFREVAMTRFWDGQTDEQTDGVTALLDLLLPSATQVKIGVSLNYQMATPYHKNHFTGGKNYNFSRAFHAYHIYIVLGLFEQWKSLLRYYFRCECLQTRSPKKVRQMTQSEIPSFSCPLCIMKISY